VLDIVGNTTVLDSLAMLRQGSWSACELGIAGANFGLGTP
jgi:hypothetical protein